MIHGVAAEAPTPTHLPLRPPLPETTSLAGVTAAANTSAVCPTNSRSVALASTSHRRRVQSCDPDMTRGDGDTSADARHRMESWWPLRAGQGGRGLGWGPEVSSDIQLQKQKARNLRAKYKACNITRSRCVPLTVGLNSKNCRK